MSLSAEDRLAIFELLSRVAYAYDQRDLPGLAECFTPDARFSLHIAGTEPMAPCAGREAIMTLYRDAMAAQTDVRRHVISNPFFIETGIETGIEAAIETDIKTGAESAIEAGIEAGIKTGAESGAEPTVVSNLTLLATEDGHSRLLCTGVYRDTLRRVDSRWRLHRRHLNLDSAY